MISDVARNKEIILIVIPTITGFVSLCASATIVYMIIFRKNSKRVPLLHQPKDRILLGICIQDIIASLTCCLSRFPAPASDDIFGFARGNVASCEFQGFMYQIAISSPLYTALLSAYYLVTVRHHAKEPFFKKRVEPYLHVFIWLWSLGTAIMGVVLNIYNYSGSALGCWITPEVGCDKNGNPEMLDDGDNELFGDESNRTCRGSGYSLWVFIMALLPITLSFIVMSVNMILVYCYVKNQENRSNQWKVYKGKLSMSFSFRSKAKKKQQEQQQKHQNQTPNISHQSVVSNMSRDNEFAVTASGDKSIISNADHADVPLADGNGGGDCNYIDKEDDTAIKRDVATQDLENAVSQQQSEPEKEEPINDDDDDDDDEDDDDLETDMATTIPDTKMNRFLEITQEPKPADSSDASLDVPKRKMSRRVSFNKKKESEILGEDSNVSRRVEEVENTITTMNDSARPFTDESMMTNSSAPICDHDDQGNYKEVFNNGWDSTTPPVSRNFSHISSTTTIKSEHHDQENPERDNNEVIVEIPLNHHSSTVSNSSKIMRRISILSTSSFMSAEARELRAKRRRRSKMSRATRDTGTLYVMAWIVTWLFQGIHEVRRIGGATDRPFWLRLFITIFFPLNGLWNFIIYLRPKLKARKKQYQGMNLRFWTLLWFTITRDEPRNRRGSSAHSRHRGVPSSELHSQRSST